MWIVTQMSLFSVRNREDLLALASLENVAFEPGTKDALHGLVPAVCASRFVPLLVVSLRILLHSIPADHQDRDEETDRQHDASRGKHIRRLLGRDNPREEHRQ